ncbi:arylsulfatase [Mucilaginibacter sabulilitoris]|uniref:Arylsulfatase n=1 Tax=Mucilaginibacter sabulilitoris TaxID=1173583 RepID=A0ABZ0TJN4_9SPHI|nr:arylsulfatase [Mucilaginibacter sabulilitoris]WPU92408.1 arylsulfatase [Mucilaginibacter sabulilitoris]
MRHFFYLSAFFILTFLSSGQKVAAQQSKPNVIIIYTDDLGYGDISCYGAKNVHTPNIDRIAANGLLFTNAHATSATCTPSRYSLLTGQYAWRKKGTGIAPGDAALLIDPARPTLPAVFKTAGYETGAIGKWHLGLGEKGIGPDWNGEIKPGPIELGFNTSFILPATVDRVPCVYVEGHRVANLDPSDPIKVDYKNPVGNWSTGANHPELLKLKPSHGHDQTIVNGVSRIGYMTGGKSALWVDEEISSVITNKAVKFIETNKSKPFFLYFATHNIHVPRVVNKRFAGKSGMGARGDAILELDWTTGEILKTLDSLKLTNNTLIIFTSDNGPVLDDGYQDEAVAKLNGHKPAGALRGGKYSAFDGGTRIPLIVSWPGHVTKGVSNALLSQIDFLASFAAFTGRPLKDSHDLDSKNAMDVLLGKNTTGRDHVIEQALNNTLSLISGDWKYIEPGNGPRMNTEVNIELGNDQKPQLYNIRNDIGEKHNLADANPGKLNELKNSLQSIKNR